MNTSNAKFNDVDEYMAACPAHVQPVLRKLREPVKSAAPKATERISYGMPLYELGGTGREKRMLYYAAFKKHISLFIPPREIAIIPEALQEFRVSKAAYRFPSDKPVPFRLIGKTVRLLVRAAMAQADENFSDKLPKKKQDGVRGKPEKAMLAEGIFHKIPDDMTSSIKTRSTMLKHWNSLTSIQRNEWICWVTHVKQLETRKKHIQRMLEEFSDGKRTPCCWPGCPHRKPLSQKWLGRKSLI